MMSFFLKMVLYFVPAVVHLPYTTIASDSSSGRYVGHSNVVVRTGSSVLAAADREAESGLVLLENHVFDLPFASLFVDESRRLNANGELRHYG